MAEETKDISEIGEYFITTFRKVPHLAPFRFLNKWWAKGQGSSSFECYFPSGAPKTGLNGPDVRSLSPRQKVGMSINHSTIKFN